MGAAAQGMAGMLPHSPCPGLTPASTLRIRAVDRAKPPSVAEQDETMPRLLLIALASCLFNLAGPTAMAADTINFCATGTMTMGPFEEHIAEIRKANRYEKADIDELIAEQKAGGPDFFSTQVVIKEEQSGSGDFDLHLFQGFSDPQAKYNVTMEWRCKSADYPVAYFVGFKVRQITGQTILVSREKGTVNIISLKTIDPDLDKPTSVKDADNHAVLCADIATGCIKTIFYGRY
jgi:ABC-type microcin C transport system permease subunit YejB